jgi:hypothetical protein
MSFDKYSDKAAEAIALIREFAKVEYWDFFKGDPEQALEAFCAMQDAAEEMGRMKAQDSAAPQDNVPGVSELPPFPKPSSIEMLTYPHGFEGYSAGQMQEYARAALRAYGQRAVVPVATKWAIYYDNLGEQLYTSGWMTEWHLYDSEEDARTQIAHFTFGKHYIPKKVEVYLANATPSQPQQEAVPAEPSEQDRIDAARYRYLRDTETLDTAVWEALEGSGSVTDEGFDQADYRVGFDRAIDAAIAMSAAKEPGDQKTEGNANV